MSTRTTRGRRSSTYQVVKGNRGRDIVDLTLSSDDEKGSSHVNAVAGPSRPRSGVTGRTHRNSAAGTIIGREPRPIIDSDSDEGKEGLPLVNRAALGSTSLSTAQASSARRESHPASNEPTAELGSWTNPQTFQIKQPRRMSTPPAVAPEEEPEAGSWANPTRFVLPPAKRPRSPPTPGVEVKRPEKSKPRQSAKKSTGGLKPSLTVIPRQEESVDQDMDMKGDFEDLSGSDMPNPSTASKVLSPSISTPITSAMFHPIVDTATALPTTADQLSEPHVTLGGRDPDHTLQSTRHSSPFASQVEDIREELADVDLATEKAPASRLLSIVKGVFTGIPTFLSDAHRQIAPMTREEWRGIVEVDGETDVEALLDHERDDPASASSTSGVDDGLAQYVPRSTALGPPPPDRRGKAIRDFDTRWIDTWNRRRPMFTKNPDLHREIFANFLHIADSEAPAINVYNDVDEEGAPPDLEFQFSNEMLYNSEVPDPELGKGCDCEGPCNPKDQFCSCLRRQEAYYYNLGMSGFAYDKQDFLRYLSVPIWECSETCGCPPSCMNRVIQRGRGRETAIDIFKTRKKGWGVRARQPIEGGIFIGIYSGELITEEESNRRGKLYAALGRTYLFDCDGYHIAHPPPGLNAIDPRLAQIAAESCARAQDIAVSEGIEIGTPAWDEHISSQFSVDAFHFGNYTRYFNHNCDPNLIITQAYVKDFHPERPILAIFTRRAVRKGEELCISYKGVLDPDEEKAIKQLKSKARVLKGKHGKVKSKSAKSSAQIKPIKLPKKSKYNVCYCNAEICSGFMFDMADSESPEDSGRSDS